MLPYSLLLSSDTQFPWTVLQYVSSGGKNAWGLTKVLHDVVYWGSCTMPTTQTLLWPILSPFMLKGSNYQTSTQIIKIPNSKLIKSWACALKTFSLSYLSDWLILGYLVIIRVLKVWIEWTCEKATTVLLFSCYWRYPLGCSVFCLSYSK